MVDGYLPKDFLEALTILDEKDVTIYAGGTDLMVRNKNAASLLPKFNNDLLYVGNLKELKGVKESINYLEIGAACTLSSLLWEKEIPEVLKECIREIASPAIRNMGTIGGNICNASPAGDTLPILYVLDAKLKLTSKKTYREVGIQDFILGPRKTILGKHEILESIIIPKTKFNKVYYEKVGARKASAISKLSFVGLAVLKDERIEDIRIAIGSVAPKIVRIKEAEDILIGSNIKDVKALIEEVKRNYSKEITPINDQRSTAVYRKTAALRLVKYFLDIKLIN
ncbi:MULTISPECIES: FAD binding domain-containing protein [unclassified Clostridium]|uniref:FAD binding domain-containing protein n=1 Tax=unclassified Clostridium TaxID=2614128 RepID=UPI000298049D|nr:MULTISPECIES: FAD binding domain-containing protein [unclassified Clostridium]EKQ55039.1 MAG: aerobic-type carbon monoxide dehydrogenase, middle subunit CoxM/CutM-like protein [Clostridium sp. Maddingley MBC34-26]